MCPNVSGDTCPLAESRGFSEGQEVPAREGLSWTRTQPPGLLLVLKPLRPFEAAGLLGPRTAQLPLGSPGLRDAVLLGPPALALCLCQRRLPPGCPLQLQAPPSPRPDPPRLPDVAPDLVGVGSPRAGKAACPSPAPLPLETVPGKLAPARLTLWNTDAKTSWWLFMLTPPQVRRSSSSSSALASSKASSWISRSASSRSLGRGARWAEAAAPPWTDAQTPLCGAVLGAWPHPGQWS